NIDISSQIYLRRISCSGNKLTTLDPKHNINLNMIGCSSNMLQSIDISNNTLLKEFYCDTNQIPSLDLSKNTELEILWCHNNLLDSLDVSRNTKLTELDCSGNNLSCLDIRNNIKLEELSINEMPGLECLCVWTANFPPDGVTVSITGSDYFNITTEPCGSNEISENINSEIRIYPNPAADFVTVETDIYGDYVLEITSINGQLMQRNVMKGSSCQMDFSAYKKGIYFLSIKSADAKNTFRIIKL
ncbi:T9SS type A sorting domain-containing protein, partial [Bacteroidota bacterium]